MRGKKRPIKVYELVTTKKYLGTYPSIIAVASEFNIDERAIDRVLVGDRNKVKNLTFMDVDTVKSDRENGRGQV